MSPLREALQSHAPSNQPWVLALSGGMDSITLLHVASELAQATNLPMRALHVDHGLHPDSAQWAAFCVAECERMGVVCTVLRVQVEHADTLGLEGAARRARYAAFAAALAEQEVLLFAHHRDDQAETFLMRALRGAAADGLAGMPRTRRIGHGALIRPWLDLPRERIAEEARQRGLRWIDDPANADPRHERNRLRHQLMPALAHAYPHLQESLAASASRVRDLSTLADFELRRRLAALVAADDRQISATVLDEPDGIAILLLSAWLRDQRVEAPRPAMWREMLRQFRAARSDRVPCLTWPGGRLYRYRQWLYFEHAKPDPERIDLAWNGQSPLTLPDGRVVAPLPSSLADSYRIRSGLDGARIQLRDGGPHRPLRLLFQEFGIPPWQREYAPMLYRGGGLAAVADWFCSADFAAQLRAAGAPPRWRIEPAAQAPIRCSR